MTLIEEIEEAAAKARALDANGQCPGAYGLQMFVHSLLWPRIREALLAAQEVDTHLRSGCTYFARKTSKRFRDAFYSK